MCSVLGLVPAGLSGVWRISERDQGSCFENWSTEMDTIQWIVISEWLRDRSLLIHHMLSKYFTCHSICSSGNHWELELGSHVK